MSGTRMAYEDALYLIGHFRSRATLEPTRVKTRISRVETFLCFLETLNRSSSDPGVKEKSSSCQDDLMKKKKFRRMFHFIILTE